MRTLYFCALYLVLCTLYVVLCSVVNQTSTTTKIKAQSTKIGFAPSLADNQDHERSGFHCTCGSFARFSGWSLRVFGRWKKDFLCLRIECHRFRALLGLHRSCIFVFVSRLFVENTQGPITARKEDQTRSWIKRGIVDTLTDRKARNYFPCGGIHHNHLRLIAATDK